MPNSSPSRGDCGVFRAIIKLYYIIDMCFPCVFILSQPVNKGRSSCSLRTIDTSSVTQVWNPVWELWVDHFVGKHMVNRALLFQLSWSLCWGVKLSSAVCFQICLRKGVVWLMIIRLKNRWFGNMSLNIDHIQEDVSYSFMSNG